VSAVLVELLEACDDKRHAEKRLHYHARTIKNLGQAEQFGAKVLYRRGWGVWLTRREVHEDR
jgi:hypothetical protein